MQKIVQKLNSGLRGSVTIPADKSISHRAVMFSSLAKGKSVIRNFSQGQDPISTLKLFKCLGIQSRYIDEKTVEIISNGALIVPSSDLDCGNSGTTMRLVSGILAGQNFNSTLIGDESLSKRPMKRVIEPLSLMGAEISAKDFKAPLFIKGTELQGIEYNSSLASAQVKSCILLAGLHAKGVTTFTEPYISRNHTELLLKYMGAEIKIDKNKVSVSKSELEPCEIDVCGDISSAAYFIVASLIVPNSEIIIKNIGLNPTRSGILDVVEKMGGQIEYLDKRSIAGEDVGDIKVSYSNLKACTIEGEIIPRLIDELPIIAVLATQAEGVTIVKNAQDLRNKESDRISAVVCELKKLGVDIEETEDGFVINGKSDLIGGCEVETYHDHRLAMSLFVAGLICQNPLCINGFEWVDISFPEFENLFSQLIS